MVQAPRVQRWILQEVHGAAEKYRGAGSCVCNNGSCRGSRVLLLNGDIIPSSYSTNEVRQSTGIPHCTFIVIFHRQAYSDILPLSAYRKARTSTIGLELSYFAYFLFSVRGITALICLTWPWFLFFNDFFNILFNRYEWIRSETSNFIFNFKFLMRVLLKKQKTKKQKQTEKFIFFIVCLHTSFIFFLLFSFFL